jgi:AraC-like DNA-binding protein
MGAGAGTPTVSGRGDDLMSALRKAIKNATQSLHVSRAWLRLLCLSYLVILVIPLVTAGLTYQWANSIIRAKIVESYELELQQLRSNTDVFFSELENMAQQIFVLPKLNKFAHYRQELTAEARYQLFELIKEFGTFRRASTVVDDYAIYFPNADMVLTSSCAYDYRLFYSHMYSIPGMSAEEWSDSIKSAPGDKGSFLPEKMRDAGARQQQYLVYRKSLMYGPDSEVLAVIYVLLNEHKFMQSLEIHNIVYDASIYILNAKGETVLAVESDSALMPESLLQDLSWTDGEDILHFEDMDGTNLAISHKSEGGMKYVIIQSMDSLMATASDFMRIQIYTIASCVLVGVCIIALFVYRTYKPLRRITGLIANNDAGQSSPNRPKNEFQYIEMGLAEAMGTSRQLHQRIEKQLPIVRASMLTTLLQGNIGIYTKENIDSRLAACNIDFPHAWFQTALFRIGGLMAESEPAYCLNLVKTELEIYAQDWSGFPCRIHFVEAYPNTLGMIVNHGNAEEDKAEWTGQFRNMLNACYRIATQNSQRSVSICVGERHPELSGIAKSYAEAQWVLNMKGIYELEEIIFYRSEEMEISSYYYPGEIENMLVAIAKTGDIKEIERIVGEIMKENFERRNLVMGVAKYLFLNMAMTVVKLHNELGLKLSTIMPANFELFDIVAQCSAPSQFTPLILQMYTLTCAYVNANKLGRQISPINSIKRFIEENYHRGDFSQSLVATQFDMTPAYLSVYFKKHAGEKMIDYINLQRLQKAKELLHTTTRSISEISRDVGFGDSISLTRVFKKYEFITPGKYRENLAGKPPPQNYAQPQQGGIQT